MKRTFNSRYAHGKLVPGIAENDHVGLATHFLASHPDTFGIEGDYIAQRDALAKLIEKGVQMFGPETSLHVFHRDGIHRANPDGSIDSGPWAGHKLEGLLDHEHID
jgi:hypothetical protein